MVGYRISFGVVDTKTGREPSEKVLRELCGDKLAWTDLETFAIGEDGSLYLLDECGNYVMVDPDRIHVFITGVKRLDG